MNRIHTYSVRLLFVGIMGVFPILSSADVMFLNDPPAGRFIEDRFIIAIPSNAVHHTPRVRDIYDEDPFGRTELRKFRETHVVCRTTMRLLNATDADVAIQDPFTTVISVLFYMNDGSVRNIQGNVGISEGIYLMQNNNIFRENTALEVEFVSLSPIVFETNNEAVNWVSNNGCNLEDIASVEVNAMGDVMLSDESEWRRIQDLLLFVEFSD